MKSYYIFTCGALYAAKISRFHSCSNGNIADFDCGHDFCFILVLLWIANKARGRSFLETASLIGLIPLLSFTSYNAFGFLEPAVIIILARYTALEKSLKFAAVCGLQFLGINIHDLVGSTLFAYFEQISLVSTGACVILSCLAIMRLRKIA
jgi:hypothetical protein